MKRIVVLFLLGSLPFFAVAQREVDDDTPHKLKDRMYFGGGFGLGGGTGYFSVSVNPILGYMITPRFSGGMGISYQLLSYTDVKPSININQYGISPFLRYNFDQLFAMAEYNLISTNYVNDSKRYFVDRMLLGLGYSQSLGGRGGLNVVGMYDVLYKANGAFASPWVVRAYFTF
ncbi:MAG: hypothetical protein HYZ44_13420 [Bacteroidetes bacterium]|nr:hypothetical protein [Bacteroidota bacterium]